MRSIGAVAVGFLFIAVLSFGTDILLRVTFPNDIDVPGEIVSVRVLSLSLTTAALYATVGCYLTARLAPWRPMGHALVLGVLVLVFTVVNADLLWMLAAIWYKLASLVIVMPCAWLGGWLAERSRVDGGPASATTGM
ncbi:MAG TPA: hypothetical protein VFK04_11915 [Gemmatimonadaceae bacterium]|nr:hypothetical protein [Gemmatimonadaceae bacterium]